MIALRGINLTKMSHAGSYLGASVLSGQNPAWPDLKIANN